jgi:hypothetical protein
VCRACRDETETKPRECHNEQDENDKEDTKTTQIRRGLPPVLTLAGGLAS